MLKTGDKAPPFTLSNQDGVSVELNEFIGKKIIIWFYPKASTPGWTVEGQGFRDESNKFKTLNIIILGVSADSVKKQKNFHSKYNFKFSLLSDENHGMLEDYGVWGKKKFMGREYMGISRITYIINENGMIEKVYDKVNTKSHANDILDELVWAPNHPTYYLKRP